MALLYENRQGPFGSFPCDLGAFIFLELDSSQ